ncbi:hypothetical protein I4U23_018571 [Adineta vaga]|nr:hypothetical protein I4U23_018571 [Adineta vaga]
MSNRGRGRGAGATSDDRSTSSSRSPSVTRPTTSSTVEDSDRLMKQLTAKRNAGATSSLGATARPAPKFTPNLGISKKKKDETDSSIDTSLSSSDKDLSSTNKKDTMNGDRSQSFRGGRGNYRGGHNNRGNFMQMEGFFQGNAQIPVASSAPFSSSRGSATKRENSASNLKMPNIKKLGQRKTTLIGDVDGLQYEIDEEYEPRQIPISERKSVFDVKKEPGVTQKIKEPILESSKHIDSFIHLFSQQKLQSATQPIVKEEPEIPTDIPKPEESLNDPTQLILMQFPDVLPCPRQSTSTTSKPELASLSDLPDGFLGKLQIFKSGKCRLKLNDDTYLDVDIGQPTSFLQNVMVTEMTSMTTTNEQGTNNDMNKLVCLGDIKHKLIVSLDVDHVLQDTRQ